MLLNLKKAKQMAWITDKHGSVLTDPVRVANALSKHWSDISYEGGGILP